MSKPDGFVFRFGGKRHALTYEQAFAYGHALLTGEHFGSAAQIFSALAKVKGRGPRAKLMLAQCEAGQRHYDTCKEILTGIFDGEDEAIVEELHSAFVYHQLKMEKEAIGEMVKVVKRHPDLPSACLFLGDMYLAAGRSDKADYCWNLAAKRDQRGGAVATAAAKQRQRLRKSRSKRK